MFYPVQPVQNYKIDAYFMDAAYLRNWGFHHTGLDINGRGGGNTDLNSPVYSIYGGIVTEARQGRWAWGNIVRVWHPSLNIYTRYAHLNNMLVREGMEIKEGTLLGGIGRGFNNAYTAHLHWDVMLKTDDTEKCFDHWPRKGEAGRVDVINNYVDPLHLLKKFGVKYYR